MTCEALLAQLRAAGARLEAAGPDRLVIRAPHSLPPDLLARAKANKPALLALLAGAPAPTPLPPDADTLAERAAFLEHEAGYPSALAAAMARLALMLVDASPEVRRVLDDVLIAVDAALRQPPGG